MANAPRGTSTGANSRPLDDTVAETGPGIADDAVMPGELAPGDLDLAEADRTVERLQAEGWADPPHADPPAGDAEAETEAHPT